MRQCTVSPLSCSRARTRSTSSTILAMNITLISTARKARDCGHKINAAVIESEALVCLRMSHSFCFNYSSCLASQITMAIRACDNGTGYNERRQCLWHSVTRAVIRERHHERFPHGPLHSSYLLSCYRYVVRSTNMRNFIELIHE